MNSVIQLKDVSFGFNGLAVLEHINLEIRGGEFVGLVGPNGGGKSTFLRIILGLLRPTSGQVRVLGKPPAKARADVGYVPQFASFRRDFPISVIDTVLHGRLGKTRLIGGYSARDRKVVRAAMQEAHILDIEHRSISTLSGGQLQRVLVARALACRPKILLLDEPTSNIDMRGEEDIFDLFRQLNERLTIVLVSHDIGFISRYVSRVVCLNRTLVCHQTEELSGDSIQQLYGESMRLIHHDHEDRWEH